MFSLDLVFKMRNENIFGTVVWDKTSWYPDMSISNHGGWINYSIVTSNFPSVLRIHDILDKIRNRIWIRWSMPLTNKYWSGSGFWYFLHWLSRCQQTTSLIKKLWFLFFHFLTSYFTFWRFIYVLFPVLRIRIRDPVPFWPLDPGSGIGFFRIPDLGSRIPNPYFRELSDNFLGKQFYNSLKIGSNYFLQHFKNKIIFNFVKFVATKNGIKTNFFHPSLLLLFLDPRSGIRDG
jgi:hypothetical protein